MTRKIIRQSEDAGASIDAYQVELVDDSMELSVEERGVVARIHRCFDAHAPAVRSIPEVNGVSIGWRGAALNFIVLTDDAQKVPRIREELAAEYEGFPLSIEVGNEALEAADLDEEYVHKLMSRSSPKKVSGRRRKSQLPSFIWRVRERMFLRGM